MSLTKLPAVGILLSIVVGLLTLFYSWMGLVGLAFFGERLHRPQDFLLVLGPLPAFPIFLMGLYSIRLSTIFLSSYVAATILIPYFLGPSIFGGSPSLAERGLLTAVGLQLVAYSVAKRRSRGTGP